MNKFNFYLNPVSIFLNPTKDNATAKIDLIKRKLIFVPPKDNPGINFDIENL